MRIKMQPLTLSDSLKCTAQRGTKISRPILICAPETECAVCAHIHIYLNRYMYIYMYIYKAGTAKKQNRSRFF